MNDFAVQILPIVWVIGCCVAMPIYLWYIKHDHDRKNTPKK